jgi:hypothetical protein
MDYGFLTPFVDLCCCMFVVALVLTVLYMVNAHVQLRG